MRLSIVRGSDNNVYFPACLHIISVILWLVNFLPAAAEGAVIMASNSSAFFYEEDGYDVCRRFQTGGMERLSEFASPNFPSKYPPNTDCMRIIHAPSGYDIVFRFNDVFQIEASYEDSLGGRSAPENNCPNDYLEIRDGRYSFSKLVGRYCGSRPPMDEVRVHSGYAWLLFHSDQLIEERGFSAEYEFVKKWNTSSSVNLETECHFSHILHLDGYLNMSAPEMFYDSKRLGDKPLECVYQIRVPQWLHVAIFIEQFELAAPNQCEQNFLEIYSGSLARKPAKRFCGIIATHTYTGESVVFLRAFVASAHHARNTHLRILFSTYSAHKNCSEHQLFECGDDICVPHALVCNGRPNCLYRHDESLCDSGPKSIFHFIANSYSPLFFMPLIIAITVTVLGLWYKPCRQVPLTQDDDLQRQLRGEDNVMTTSMLSSILESSRSGMAPASILTNSRTNTGTQTYPDSNANGVRQPVRNNRFTWTTDSLEGDHTALNGDVWRTAESSSTPSLIMENTSLTMETSFITVNV